jgi:hypothetical protein
MILAEVFKEPVLTLCKDAQLLLSEDELEFLNQWVCA